MNDLTVTRRGDYICIRNQKGICFDDYTLIPIGKVGVVRMRSIATGNYTVCLDEYVRDFETFNDALKFYMDIESALTGDHD